MTIQHLFSVGIYALSLLLLASGILELVIHAIGALRIRQAASDMWGETLADSRVAPGVSVVSVVKSALEASLPHVRRLMQLRSGDLEVVLVVHDPSETELAEWIDEFGLRDLDFTPDPAWNVGPIRRVLTSGAAIRFIAVQGHSCYQEALRSGFSAATKEWVCVVEMNACFTQDIVQRLFVPLLDDPDRTLAAGSLAPAPDCASMLGRSLGMSRRRIWLARCGLYFASNVFAPAPGTLWLCSRAAILRGGAEIRSLIQAMRLHLNNQVQYRIALIPERASSLHIRVHQAHLENEERRQLASNDTECLSIRGGIRSRLGVAAISFARLAPFLTALTPVLGSIGYVAGWIPLATFGLAVACSLLLEALLSMTAILLCSLVAESEAQAGDFAAC